MSVAVEVAVLSGRAATEKADPEEQVDTLKIRAQNNLGVGKGRLVNSCGSALVAS